MRPEPGSLSRAELSGRNAIKGTIDGTTERT